MRCRREYHHRAESNHSVLCRGGFQKMVLCGGGIIGAAALPVDGCLCVSPFSLQSAQIFTEAPCFLGRLLIPAEHNAPIPSGYHLIKSL